MSSFSGCVGTIASRNISEGDPFGQYPYQAVVTDCNEVFRDKKFEFLGYFNTYIGVIAFPFDLAVDTVLLPIDLFFWPFGFKKKDYMRYERDAAGGRIG